MLSTRIELRIYHLQTLPNLIVQLINHHPLYNRRTTFVLRYDG